MFEDKTFENILSNMLDYVSSRHPDLDISTGSIIYTALAPIALELESAYHEMDMILEETFLETASLEYLTKHGDQMGVRLIEATYGHFEGEFDAEVEIGSRFNLDKFNYTVVEKIQDGDSLDQYYKYELVCETAGSEPNSYLGDLTPITYIRGLTHAKLTNQLVYGEDEEDVESYRYRIQLHATNPPTNANVSQYNEWLDNYYGIGKYRVTPCWNGGNTVKLTILNAQNTAADEDLINDVQNYIDPPTSDIDDNVSSETYPQGRGMGNGEAPIGAIVTVDTVTQIPVTIECNLKLKEGCTSTLAIQNAVEEYLIAGALERTSVDYIALSAIIYNTGDVEDIVKLIITVKDVIMDIDSNSFVKKVALDDDEIAILDVDNSVWSV